MELFDRMCRLDDDEMGLVRRRLRAKGIRVDTIPTRSIAVQAGALVDRCEDHPGGLPMLREILDQVRPGLGGVSEAGTSEQAPRSSAGATVGIVQNAQQITNITVQGDMNLQQVSPLPAAFEALLIEAIRQQGESPLPELLAMEEHLKSFEGKLEDLQDLVEPIFLKHATEENRTFLQKFARGLPDRVLWLGLKTVAMGIATGGL